LYEEDDGSCTNHKKRKYTDEYNGAVNLVADTHLPQIPEDCPLKTGSNDETGQLEQGHQEK
jgi:hypothetical protein